MKDFFKKQGIEFYSLIPLSRCKVIKSYLLEKSFFSESDNAILFLIPYRSEKRPVNLTVYASVLDYHAYVERLSSELYEYVKEGAPELYERIKEINPLYHLVLTIDRDYYTERYGEE